MFRKLVELARRGRVARIASARASASVVGILALLVSATASAIPAGHELLYDVDFSSLSHRVGAVVKTDVGPNVRSGLSQVIFGDPTIVASYGAMPDEALVFEGNGPAGLTYDQIRFDLDMPRDQLQLSFDLMMTDDFPYRDEIYYTYDSHGNMIDEHVEIVPDYKEMSLFLDRDGGLTRIDVSQCGLADLWSSAPFSISRTIGSVTRNTRSDCRCPCWLVDGSTVWRGRRAWLL